MRVSSRTEPQTRWLRKGPLAMKTAADCATAAGRVLCGSSPSVPQRCLCLHCHRTCTHTHTYKRVPNLHVQPPAHTQALYASACGWRLAAGRCSPQGLDVSFLLDTLVTLIKRACVGDNAVVMKLSTASHTRVMDWTSVCVYDWMYLRGKRGKVGGRAGRSR